VSKVAGKERLLIGVNGAEGKVLFRATTIRFDSAWDLALLWPTVSRDTGVSGNTVSQGPLALSGFAGDSDVREGIGLTILGFPLGLGAGRASNYPITRIGVIAQVIPGEPTFLINGVVSHGNSGSPVFASYSGNFLGLIQSFPADYIEFFDENRSMVASLPYNSGLTTCISAATVRKFMLGLR
jgi:hypothetical protein